VNCWKPKSNIMICLICKKEFKALTNTHLSQHGITPKEYELKFNCKTVPEGWCCKENNPFYGKSHNETSKVQSDAYKKAASERRRGKIPSDFLVNVTPEEFSRHLSNALSGEKNGMYGKSASQKCKEVASKRWSGIGNPKWMGGITSFDYPLEFRSGNLRDVIRNREGHRCFLCGASDNGLKRKLDIHHIDYNKNNSEKRNLVALCHKCHIQTNTNRNCWKFYLERLLNIRYGNQQPSPLNDLYKVSGKVQRLIGEDGSTNKPNTSAQHLNEMMI